MTLYFNIRSSISIQMALKAIFLLVSPFGISKSIPTPYYVQKILNKLFGFSFNMCQIHDFILKERFYITIYVYTIIPLQINRKERYEKQCVRQRRQYNKINKRNNASNKNIYWLHLATFFA